VLAHARKRFYPNPEIKSPQTPHVQQSLVCKNKTLLLLLSLLLLIKLLLIQILLLMKNLR
jgi:hypothetical protein